MSALPTQLDLIDSGLTSSMQLLIQDQNLRFQFADEADTPVYFNVSRRQLGSLRLQLEHTPKSATLTLKAGKQNRVIVEFANHTAASEVAQHISNVKNLFMTQKSWPREMRRLAIGVVLGIAITMLYALKVAPSQLELAAMQVASTNSLGTLNQLSPTQVANTTAKSAEAWQPE